MIACINCPPVNMKWKNISKIEIKYKYSSIIAHIIIY